MAQSSENFPTGPTSVTTMIKIKDTVSVENEIINPAKMLNSRGTVMAVPEAEKYWCGM